MQIRQTRKDKFFCALILLAISCQLKPKVTRIVDGSTYRVGAFAKDSTPEGAIRIYETGTNRLLGTQQYENGMLNGLSAVYAGNRIILISNYKKGMKEGFDLVYDSASNYLLQRNYYFHDKKFGPVYTYNEDREVIQYIFSSYENEELFVSELDSTKTVYKHSDFDKLSNFTISNVTVDGDDKLNLFAYLIRPPKVNVSRKVLYLDQNEQPIDSVLLMDGNQAFWEGTVDRPNKNRTLVFMVNAYDSLTKESRTIKNYIRKK